jgi:hypothetical protein
MISKSARYRSVTHNKEYNMMTHCAGYLSLEMVTEKSRFMTDLVYFANDSFFISHESAYSSSMKIASFPLIFLDPCST